LMGWCSPTGPPKWPRLSAWPCFVHGNGLEVNQGLRGEVEVFRPLDGPLEGLGVALLGVDNVGVANFGAVDGAVRVGEGPGYGNDVALPRPREK
jgi:hypothetical protein